MSLKKGYSYETVAGNIRDLQLSGNTHNTAVAIAYNLARKCYFKRFPQGALPEWLAYPKTRRVAQYYAPNGAPMRENPAERAIEKIRNKNSQSYKIGGRYLELFSGKNYAFVYATKRDVLENKPLARLDDLGPQRKLKKNPSIAGNANASTKEIGAAMRRYEGFTGRAPGEIVKLPAPQPFKVGVAFGTLVEVVYQSERDGQLYRHKFRKSSRPLVVASHDGKQVQIVGGRFAFTDRGIVDK